MLFDAITDLAKKAGIPLLLLVSTATMQATAADEAGSAVTTGGDNVPEVAGAFTPAQPFPQWPQQETFKREIIPPPPPGPYMSSALSDYSVKGPAFARDNSRSDKQVLPPGRDIRKFSPDRPWPDDLRPTQRWMPENGYHFIPPMIKQAAPGYGYPPQQYRSRVYAPSDYRRGYQYRQYRGQGSSAPNGSPGYRSGRSGAKQPGPQWMPPSSQPHRGYDRQSYMPPPAYRAHHGTGYQPAVPPARAYPVVPSAAVPPAKGH